MLSGRRLSLWRLRRRRLFRGRFFGPNRACLSWRSWWRARPPRCIRWTRLVAGCPVEAERLWRRLIGWSLPSRVTASLRLLGPSKLLTRRRRIVVRLFGRNRSRPLLGPRCAARLRLLPLAAIVLRRWLLLLLLWPLLSSLLCPLRPMVVRGHCRPLLWLTGGRLIISMCRLVLWLRLLRLLRLLLWLLLLLPVGWRTDAGTAPASATLTLASSWPTDRMRPIAHAHCLVELGACGWRISSDRRRAIIHHSELVWAELI